MAPCELIVDFTSAIFVVLKLKKSRNSYQNGPYFEAFFDGDIGSVLSYKPRNLKISS